MRSTLLTIALFAAALTLACGGRRETATPAAKTPAGDTTAKQTSGTSPGTPATEGTSVGSTMPAYSAQTLDGKPFDLATERGNVVLLNLWATWCGPCRYEIPELQKLHDQNSAQKFKVIGVSLDDTGADSVKQFMTEHKMTYPVVIDAEGKLANIFQTSVIPTTVLIDRNGKIVWKQFGAISGTDAELKKALETALNVP